MELSLERIGAARAVLIAGATASGKSATAMRLAENAAALGREAWIVNANSMQVYSGLRILTARPGEAEEARVPHRLYGHVSPGTRYSVGAWLADMEKVLGEAERVGALVIAVGGTGLYFKALTEGLAPVPAIPPAVRTLWKERLEAEGVAALHAELTGRDPHSAATIRPNDMQRTIRALEVLEATGEPLSDWQRREQGSPLIPEGETMRLVIDVPRDVLHARIEERFDRMVEQGALEEVRALVALNLDPQLPAMKAIGVRPFTEHLRGEMSLEAAIARAKTETRRYAKRQSTWLRNQMTDWSRSAT